MAGTKRAKPQTAKRAATPSKKPKSAARRAKKPVATPKATRTRADKPLAAAAPLLATAPKKVGKVANAVKPGAPYQPKITAGPDTPANEKKTTKAPRAAALPALPAFDPLALARPWMRLGFQMTMSNLALQTSIVRASMDLPPAAAAMHRGSAAYKAWFAMLDSARPA